MTTGGEGPPRSVVSSARRRLYAQAISRRRPALDVCPGRCGTINQACRDGVEDQLGPLGLVLGTVVLRTARYVDAVVVRQLPGRGHAIREEDITRLSPLKHRNLNLLGRYGFTASAPAAGARIG